MTQKSMPQELDGNRLAEAAIGKADRVAVRSESGPRAHRGDDGCHCRGEGKL